MEYSSFGAKLYRTTEHTTLFWQHTHLLGSIVVASRPTFPHWSSAIARGTANLAPT